MTAHAQSSRSVNPFKQPKAVFAVAFACVVSFMGIGLVDPILPAISDQLNATPSQVTLLFTSYLVVTAVAMLITNWVSSRIGAKRTLIVGLALIVVFAALAGGSGSIGGIVGFRVGWGIGNALFIATSLAVIVASASGGFVGAIILYETALGVGIAVGPLLGGLLGNVSWRGPFYGVAVLMAVALVATVVLVEPIPLPARRTGLGEPLRALRHPVGHVLRNVTGHGEVGRLVAEHAERTGARAIVVGAPAHGGLTALMDAGTGQSLMRYATCDVVLINPRSAELKPAA
ncbi:MFS transporter [Actinacidiphila glaucinigra]|uniref:MFS transporter n=1 Tax=Actinacidiphila glaucinigra TaxID=235986 RepID=UPI0036AE09F3